MDVSSWDFLRYHIGSEAPSGELWVVTHRPLQYDVTQCHACVPTHAVRTEPPSYAELLKNPRVCRVILRGLSEEAMLELIRAEHTVQHVPDAIRRVVVSRAAGNALFGVALVESLVEAGACRVAGGVMSVDEAVLGTVSVGDRLERVIVSKIDRTPRCRDTHSTQKKVA